MASMPASAPPTVTGMSEHSPFEVGDVLRFTHLHLSHGPLATTVMASCDRYAVIGYTVGGVPRVIIVDRIAGTRARCDDDRFATQCAAADRHQDILDALCDGRLGLRHGSETPLDLAEMAEVPS